MFLWEQESDSIDGTVNGRRAVSSAQISGDIVTLGKFSEMLIGSWLGIEFLVNNYTRAVQGSDSDPDHVAGRRPISLRVSIRRQHRQRRTIGRAHLLCIVC
jgi:hypothetical protein